jgi:hypothetical protein
MPDADRTAWDVQNYEGSPRQLGPDDNEDPGDEEVD